MERIDKIISNYRTSLPGILALVLIGLNIANYISTEQLTVSVSVLTAAGLMASRDA